MTTTTTDVLRVPGAHLHYEVSGTGPVLLLIPGGAMDSGPFGSITGSLSEDYTVVTYDPRGISRSKLDDPDEEQHVSVHADDAHLLLAELGSEPAYVVSSSGGALTGLSLVERHPGQVHTLLAHEPPLANLLPDAEKYARSTQEIQDIYRKRDPRPRWRLSSPWRGSKAGSRTPSTSRRPRNSRTTPGCRPTSASSWAS